MRCEAPVPGEALAAIRAPLAALRAEVVDPPVIQPLNLLLDLAGEAMRARLFIVQDEGGREACLRPDFTVAVARGHMEGARATGRYQYEGRAFRVAPPGAEKDHPEEFLQMGVEVFGETASPQADGEILAAAWNAAKAAGRSDLALRLGDVGLFAEVLEALDVAEPVRGRLTKALGRPRQLSALLERAGGVAPLEGRAAQIASLPLAEASAAIEKLWADEGLDAVGGRSAGEIAERLTARSSAAGGPRLTSAQLDAINQYLALSGPLGDLFTAISGIAGGLVAARAHRSWSNRLKGLESDLSRMTLSTRFARAFGYYDGFLFEVVSAALPADAPLAAGGRYDGLTAQLGGAPSTAVGCMVRPARAFGGGA